MRVKSKGHVPHGGYYGGRKSECNYCGARDVEIRRKGHRDYICQKCAERNKYDWGAMKKNPGWREDAKPTLTHKGIRNVAPRHYEVSHKREFVETLRRPLVAVGDLTTIRTVEKALVPRNPIDEIKNIRNRYQGEYTVIRETMQNSERAGRSNHMPIDIEITITPEMYKIEDNGGGVDKHIIDVVFNLGQSGWDLDSETNPFGQGFMSFILLFNKAEVISNDINAEFDWEKIEKEYDENKSFDLTKAYTAQEAENPDVFGAKGKFIAIFTKPMPTYDYKKAIEQAKIYARTLPVRTVLINRELANNKIDFSHVPIGYTRVEKPYKPIEPKLGVEGHFAPSTHDDALRLYFQGLPVGAATAEMVDNYYRNLPAMTGDVNINTTFYGRPSENRDSWIQDDAIKRTESIVKELAKYRAVEMIKTASEAQIEQYQHFISRYTVFDEIKYHIRFEVIEPEIVEAIKKVERELHKEMTELEFNRYIGELFRSKSELEKAIERAKNYGVQVDAEEYNRQQRELVEEQKRLLEARHEESDAEQRAREKQQDVIEGEQKELKKEEEKQESVQKKTERKIREFIETREEGGHTAGKWKKETFWLKRSDSWLYGDSIKMAGYYGIPVAFADNKFQEDLFKIFENFHHLTELESSMKLIHTLSAPGARNAQERRIEYVMRVFLDAAGFSDIKLIISNITSKKVLQIAQTKRRIEEPIDIVAYADIQAGAIYLQRELSYGTAHGTTDYRGIESLAPYLEYNDFPLSNKSIGQGDIAVFSKIRKELAHELAHIKKGTKDDTRDHYLAIIEIDTAFDKALAEFKASSTVTGAQKLEKKARERLGITDEDTVVVTYTKGSREDIQRQEKPAPRPRKTRPQDIYIDKNGLLYTYEKLLDVWGESFGVGRKSALEERIAAGMYTYSGYKIGDRIVYETVRGETEAEITGVRDYKFVLDHDYYYAIKPSEARKTRKAKPKHHKGEIFIDDEYNLARTYEEIEKLTGEEARHYRPAGYAIGDRVKIQGRAEGIIKSIEQGTLRILLDNDEIRWALPREVEKVEKTERKQLSIEDLLK